jgi:predicted RNA-binding Zn-ribbon protein involved in translation (DUF1610 family)
MLPENRPLDYRISTTATEDFEDEFECDRCGNTDYRLINYETQGEIQTYAKCLECGWKNLTTATEEIKSCLDCRYLESNTFWDEYNIPLKGDPSCDHWIDVPPVLLNPDEWVTYCPKHCGSFEAITPVDAAIASVGGVG